MEVTFKLRNEERVGIFQEKRTRKSMAGGGKAVGKVWSTRRREKLRPTGYRFLGQDLVLALKGLPVGFR